MPDQKISRTELLSYLNDVEKRFPVDEWKIGEIRIWPLVKIDMFFRLVSMERNSLVSTTKTKSLISEKIRNGYRAIVSLYHYFVLKYFSVKKSIPYFYCDSSSHRIWFENEFINRYFNPLKSEIKELKKLSLSLTINDDFVGFERYPKQENILFINKYAHAFKIFKLITRKKKIFYGNGFDQFLTEINREKPVLKIDLGYKNILYAKVLQIYWLSHIVDLLIIKHKPKVIFELCYYSISRFAVNFSAYKRQIPTVEIQHGGLGRDHVAYSGWGKVPDKGYNLLPQTFWAWDRNSEQIVKDWSKNNLFHQTVLGGNPWLMFALKHSHQYQFPHNKKIILYTLQGDLVSEYIYEAISKSSEDYEWWVRSHPRFPQVGVIFKNELEKRGISRRVVFERANEYPLPIMLNKSGIHLSGNSGSILEASLLGIRSLILDQIGEKYYQKLIESGEAFPVYPKNSSYLLFLINKLFDSTPTEERLIENGDNIKILEDWV